MTEFLDIITLATITGFVGDALLQIFTKYLHLGGPTGWGLLPYFSQHGSVESTFIAGGMMAIFYIAYIKLLHGLPTRQTLRVCVQRVAGRRDLSRLVDPDPSKATKHYAHNAFCVSASILRNVTHVLVSAPDASPDAPVWTSPGAKPAWA